MAERSCSPMARSLSPGARENVFTIVEAGEKFAYTIPSFPVITVRLRHVKYRIMDVDGQLKVFDGFMRDCSSINRPFPAMIVVGSGCSNAFFVDII